MARKPKVDPFDFSNDAVFGSNPEAVANYQRYQTKNDPRNREAEGWAFIKALVDDGVSLTDEDQVKILNDFIQTGSSSFSKAPADFSNVESSVISDQASAGPVLPQVNEDPGFLGSVVRMGANAYQSLVPWESDVARELTDNPDKALLAAEAATAHYKAANATKEVQAYAADEEGMSAFRDAPALDTVLERIAGPFRIWDTLEKAFLPQGAEDRLAQQRRAEAEGLATSETAKAQELEARLGGQYSALSTVARNAGSIASQPEQLGSVAGGVAGGFLTRTPAGAAVGAGIGSVPAIPSIYNAAIAEAKEWPGITDEERHEYGMMQVAAELGPDVAFSVFGTGLSGAFSKWGPTSIAQDAIRSAVQSRLSAKLGALAVGGGLSEVAAERTGLAATDIMADRVGAEETKEAIKATVAEEEGRGLEKYIDPFVGGVLFSAAGAPSVVTGHVQQRKQAEAAANALETYLNMGAEGIQGAIDLANAVNEETRTAEETKQDTELNLDIAREEERIRNEEARTRAFEQAEAERERENQRKELEEEAGFQTIERGDLDGTTRVDRYGGRTESVPGSPAAGRDGVVERVEVAPAREVLPEDVEAQREEAARAEAERKERVARLDRIDAIRKRQELAAKKAAETQDKEQKKQDRAARSRQARIADELIAENPDATPDQLEQELQARMAMPAPVVEAKPAPVAKKAARRANSKPAPKPVAPGKPVENAPPITKSDKDLTDADVDELAGYFTRMAEVPSPLGMADSAADLREAGRQRRGETTPEAEATSAVPSPEPSARIPDIDLGAFKAATKKFAKALINRATRDSDSVQKMIWQGKLNVYPSAAAVGRSTSNAAEYDAGSGTMSLYMDKLTDPSDAVSIIARAFHEATHAGQFNDRTGRSNLFKHFLGDPKVQKSAATIRKAAANGNKIAKEAVRKAEADTASRQGDNRFEDLEVVGYFTSEVVESRGSALGTVGGVARDITTSAREFLRDNLGMDLDITLGDLNTAAANVGTEIAQTNTRGLNSPQVLGMIYNINPTALTPGQEEALDNGWVYESVDGTQKFVLSDHEATVKPQAVAALRSARGATRLADVIDHPILFSEREGAADLPVYAVSEVLGTARGMYDPGDPAIYVKESVLNNPEELKGVLLHETQHYVQDMDGRSGQFYDGRDLVTKQAELQSELADRVRTLDTAARELLDTLPNTLPARERGRLLRDLMRNTTEKDSVNAAVARDFVQGLETVPQEAADAIAIYEQVRQDYNAYLPKYKAAQAAAHNDYLANITEGEAHFVQDNAGFDTTGVNPEPEMRDRVARQIDVPSQSAPVLGMASDSVDRSFESRRNSQIEQELATILEESQTQDTKRAANSSLDKIASSMEALPSVKATAEKIDALEKAGFYVVGPDAVTQDQFVSRADRLNASYIQMLETMDKEYPTEIARANELDRIASNVQLLTDDLQDMGRRYLSAAARTRAELNTRTKAGKEQARRYDEAIPNEVVAMPSRSPILGMADDGIDALWGTNIPEPDLPSSTREVLPANRFVAPDSPEFKKWFGNSKITNEDGSAKAMFHATRAPENFDVFKRSPTEIGIHVGTTEQANDPAFVGAIYANRPKPSSEGDNARIYPVYVRIENPLRTYDAFGQGPMEAFYAIDAAINNGEIDPAADVLRKELRDIDRHMETLRDADDIYESMNEAFEMLKDYVESKGYDGIVYKNDAEGVARVGNQDPAVRNFHPYASSSAQDSYIVFNPNQIKSASSNNGAYSLDNPSILGMASPENTTQRRRSASAVDMITPESIFRGFTMPVRDRLNTGRVAVTSVLRNDRGLGREVLKAWEHAKNTPAAEIARANASHGKFVRALQDLADERGVTYEALSEQLMNELDALDKAEDSYSANLAAWKSVMDNYGDAGKHMMDMRNHIDGMSKEMLLQQYQAGVKLPPAEAKQFATIANNLGRYTHRLYAAHLGKSGKKYAYAMLRSWKKSQKGEELTPDRAKAAKVVQSAIKVLVDDHLMIPDDVGLWDMDAVGVKRLFDTWNNPAEGLSVDEMREALADRRDEINGDSNKLTNAAEDIAKDLLGLLDEKNSTAIGSYYRGGKLDTGILQDRKKIPVEIRALMGEITEPGHKMLATVAKQAEFVARNRMFLELKNVADARDLQPPTATGSDVVRNNEMSRLEGPGYGALQGWYASPNMKALLSDVREQLMTMEQAAFMAGTNPSSLGKAALTKGLDVWTGVAAASKARQILGNAWLYPMNFAGSWAMLASNGNYNPATWGRGLQDMVALIRYARNSSLGLGTADLAVRYGVTDNATIGELKGLPYQELQKYIASLSGEAPSWTSFKSFWKTTGRTITEAYAMMDVWAKIANFHHESNFLKDFHKKNGDTRTDEQIYREAADIVNATNISYKRAMPLVKAIERGGITHFGTYFYETFRSQGHNAARGLYELKLATEANTPEARNAMLRRGGSRLVGQAAFWTFSGYMTKTLNALAFGDDEDDAWSLRGMLPEFMQNQDLYEYGKGEDGKPIYYGVSRVDPIGPVTDIMRQALVGDFDYEGAKESLLDLYVRPRILPHYVNTYNAIKDDKKVHKDPLAKQLFPTGYGAIARTARMVQMNDNTLNAWMNAIEATWLPGTATAYNNFNPEITAPTSDSNWSKANYIMANAARYMGATFVKAEPARMMGTQYREYDDVQKANRMEIASFFDNTPNASHEETLRKVLPMVEDELRAWKRMERVYKGMELAKLSDEIVGEAMASIGTKEVQKQIADGVFESRVINKTSIDNAKTREMRGKSEKERAKIEEKWDAVWATLEAVQGDIE